MCSVFLEKALLVFDERSFSGLTTSDEEISIDSKEADSEVSVVKLEAVSGVSALIHQASFI